LILLVLSLMSHDDDTIDMWIAEATAAIRGLATDHGSVEVRRRVELAQQQDWRCIWCEQPLLPADIGAGRTQVDHVIPIIRGGPREPWNLELLHSKCNGSKGDRMTPRAWALARAHGIEAVPPDPAALRHGVETVRTGLRRIQRVLADFEAAHLEIEGDVELHDLLAEVHAAVAVTGVRSGYLEKAFQSVPLAWSAT
jgi:hypothetical protein